jgi:hypothetical protein
MQLNEGQFKVVIKEPFSVARFQAQQQGKSDKGIDYGLLFQVFLFLITQIFITN